MFCEVIRGIHQTEYFHNLRDSVNCAKLVRNHTKELNPRLTCIGVSFFDSDITADLADVRAIRLTRKEQ